jgi:heat shock protein HslJ
MKIKLIIIATIIFAFISCGSTKKAENSKADHSALAGTWELTSINESSASFETLYARKKPFMTIDLIKQSINGNTSCNSFNGSIKLEGNQISFPEPIAMTRMACMDGNGETVFLDALRKVTNFSIDKNGNTLHLTAQDVELMRLIKK